MRVLSIVIIFAGVLMIFISERSKQLRSKSQEVSIIEDLSAAQK